MWEKGKRNEMKAIKEKNKKRGQKRGTRERKDNINSNESLWSVWRLKYFALHG